MAKLKKRSTGNPAPSSGGDSSGTDYSDWLPEQKRMIALADLEFYPDNWLIVGRLDPARRSALKDDILANGIREPLHVWLHGGRLIVVSGNERLDIARELSEGERRDRKLQFLPCIRKEFSSEALARNHVITVNENRKIVKLPPVDRVVALYPPESFPLLYADFRGKHTSESETDRIKSPGGDIILESPRKVFELLDNQRSLREELRSVTGWSERFTEKTVASASKKLREKAGVDSTVKLSPAMIQEAKKAAAKLVTIQARMGQLEAKMSKLKVDMAALKIEARKSERVLEKARKAGYRAGRET